MTWKLFYSNYLAQARILLAVLRDVNWKAGFHRLFTFKKMCLHWFLRKLTGVKTPHLSGIEFTHMLGISEYFCKSSSRTTSVVAHWTKTLPATVTVCHMKAHCSVIIDDKNVLFLMGHYRIRDGYGFPVFRCRNLYLMGATSLFLAVAGFLGFRTCVVWFCKFGYW